MMKPLRAAALAALVAAPLAVLAAPPGLYAGGHVGANDLDSRSATVNFGAGVTAPGSVSLDSGAHLGLMFGRQTENARFELEYQHGRFDLTGLQLGGITGAASGSGHYDALTANAYRTLALADRWTAFAGLGIGWGRSSMTGASLGSCNCFPASSKSGLAYQARIGAEYEVAATHLIFGQLNWLSLPRIGGASPGVSYSRKGVGSLSVGYRKLF